MINPSIPEIHRQYNAKIAELQDRIAELEAELASLQKPELSSEEKAKRAAYQREYRARKRNEQRV